jgi:hypothetical protein
MPCIRQQFYIRQVQAGKTSVEPVRVVRNLSVAPAVLAEPEEFPELRRFPALLVVLTEWVWLAWTLFGNP